VLLANKVIAKRRPFASKIPPQAAPPEWTHPDTTRPPTAAEAFAGGGLFALAFKVEGVRSQHHCEFDADAVATLKANIDPKVEVCDAWDWHPKVPQGGLDILAGGPPCQPWSQIGAKKGPDDPRDMWPVVVRWVREVKPRVVCMENVTGILAPKYAPYFEDWWEQMRREGYEGVVWSLIAADYGTPQARPRVFFIAWPIGAPWGRALRTPPTPTHADPRRAAQLGRLPWTRAVDRLNEGCCAGYGYSACLNLGNYRKACETCVEGSNFEQAPNDDLDVSLELSPEAKVLMTEMAGDEQRMSKHPPIDVAGLTSMQELTGKRLVGTWLAPTMTKAIAKGAPVAIATARYHPLKTPLGAPSDIALGCPLPEHTDTRLRKLRVREAAKLQDVPQWYEFQSVAWSFQDAEAEAHAQVMSMEQRYDPETQQHVDIPRFVGKTDAEIRAEYDAWTTERDAVPKREQGEWNKRNGYRWTLRKGRPVKQYHKPRKAPMMAQIGNGIPVNLGRAVIQHMLRALGYRLPVFGAMAALPDSGLWPMFRPAMCRWHGVAGQTARTVRLREAWQPEVWGDVPIFHQEELRKHAGGRPEAPPVPADVKRAGLTLGKPFTEGALGEKEGRAGTGGLTRRILLDGERIGLVSYLAPPAARLLTMQVLDPDVGDQPFVDALQMLANDVGPLYVDYYVSPGTMDAAEQTPGAREVDEDEDEDAELVVLPR
jgi:site-specific DNA-cytosine methylase